MFSLRSYFVDTFMVAVAAGCEPGQHEIEKQVGLTPKTNLFGSTFFTLTGFHGAHVTIGVVWLLSLFFLSFKKGMVTPERDLDLDLAALYWVPRKGIFSGSTLEQGRSCGA